MTDNPPDRLSVDPASPHHDPAALARGVRVRLNGAERTDVEEHRASEGWIRVSASKAKDRAGKPITVQLRGKVEPYFHELG